MISNIGVGTRDLFHEKQNLLGTKINPKLRFDINNNNTQICLHQTRVYVQ